MVRVCFVCQSGALERKAVLLAASLRRLFPSGLELVAAHPASYGRLQPSVLEAMKDLDVLVVPIAGSPIEAYPIGNKFSALTLLGGDDVGIFLDTDMLAVEAPPALPSSVAMTPATHDHHHPRVWEHAYAKFGLEIPQSGFRTLISRRSVAPYFNAGMIALPGRIATEFTSCLVDTASRLDADPRIPVDSKRPFLDQLSIPIAALRLGLEVTSLDPKWNFPGWAWEFADDDRPYFYHYQTFSRLRQSNSILRSINDVRELFPNWCPDLSLDDFIGT